MVFKHDYLRSRASICLSLSSPSSPSGDLSINSYTFVSFSHSTLWRYSCLHLGSLHPRILSNKVRNAPIDITNNPCQMAKPKVFYNVFWLLWKMWHHHVKGSNHKSWCLRLCNNNFIISLQTNKCNKLSLSNDKIIVNFYDAGIQLCEK